MRLWRWSNRELIRLILWTQRSDGLGYSKISIQHFISKHIKDIFFLHFNGHVFDQKTCLQHLFVEHIYINCVLLLNRGNHCSDDEAVLIGPRKLHTPKMDGFYPLVIHNGNGKSTSLYIKESLGRLGYFIAMFDD